MGAQQRQIVIKKPPSLMVKKKGESGPSPAHFKASAQSGTPATASPFHCTQCGARRIDPGSPQFFDFRCTYCGQVNQSRGYVSGTDMTCVACGNSILVPPPPTRPVPAHLGGVGMAPQRLKFFCVFCGQKLSASLDMVGQPTVCPSCHRGLTVPQPPSTPIV